MKELCDYGCGRKVVHTFKNVVKCCATTHNQCPVKKEKINKARALLPKISYPKIECVYCSKLYANTGIIKHTRLCYLNPQNIKLCPVCDNPIKDYKNATTCSCACSNTYFRTGKNHPSYDSTKITSRHHRTICFTYHNHKCAICDESLMLDVHP